MILEPSDNFIINYNKFIKYFFPKFEIIANDKKEESVLLSITIPLRIAAKLCKKFGYKKEDFLSAASGNFDLENNSEIKREKIKQINSNLN